MVTTSLRQGFAIAMSASLCLAVFAGCTASDRSAHGDRDRAALESSPSTTTRPPGTGDRQARRKPAVVPRASDSAVSEQLVGVFGGAVTSARVRASGEDQVRVDVETTCAWTRDSTGAAKDIAVAAASSPVVLDAYPVATVSAYVWPLGGDRYMVRATGEWNRGQLQGPMDVYVDEALR